MPRLIDVDKLRDIISDTWILDRIDEQPIIDAEPVRHGHWEYHTRHQNDCNASCSVCRKRTTFFFKNGTKYCPFCGAKMDE